MVSQTNAMHGSLDLVGGVVGMFEPARMLSEASPLYSTTDQSSLRCINILMAHTHS